MKNLTKLILSSALALTVSQNIQNSQIQENLNEHLSRREFIRIIDEVTEIMDSIYYKSDEEVHGRKYYWQKPEETLYLKSGDCYDQATLAHLLLRERGVSSELVRGKFTCASDLDHCWNEIYFGRIPYILETSSKKASLKNKYKLDLSKNYFERPLTRIEKRDIKKYAKKNNLELDFKRTI